MRLITGGRWAGVVGALFLDMGVVPGAGIKLMKLAPMGDPMESESTDTN